MDIFEMERGLIMLQNSRATLDILISHREREIQGLDDWIRALSCVCDNLEVGITILEKVFESCGNYEKGEGNE